LLGLAIVAYVLLNIGVGRVLAVVSRAHVLPLLLALSLALVSWGVRFLKLRLLLKADSSAAHCFEIFVASRTGKELSQAGYFLPLLARRLRSMDTLAALLADRYLETLATLAVALCCAFIAASLPWTWFLRGAFAILLGLMAAVVVAHVPAPGRGPELLLRFMAHVRSLQQALRVSLCDIGGVVALTLLATLLDFLVVRIVFASLDVEVKFIHIPIVWAATALVSAATLTAYGPGDYSTVQLYSLLGNVSPEATAAMLLVGRGVIGMSSLGVFVLFGHLLLDRTDARAHNL
jgi:hypothetical protein